MLSFLAGMNQKGCFAFFTVVHTPVVCNDRLPWFTGCRKRRFLRSCRTAEAHPHDQAVQQTIVIPLLPYTWWSMSLCTGRQISFVAQRHISMVQTVLLDHRVSLLHANKVFLSLSCRSCRVSQVTPAVLGQVVARVWRSTGAVLGQGYSVYRCYGPDSSYRLEVPQVTVHHGRRHPCRGRSVVVLVTKRFPCCWTK